MKTIGIIGGMGPEATLDLFHKIISSTSAGCDQEHLPFLVDNTPQIPDRSAFLLNGGEDPFPYLFHSSRKLEIQGAFYPASNPLLRPNTYSCAKYCKLMIFYVLTVCCRQSKWYLLGGLSGWANALFD